MTTRVYSTGTVAVASDMRTVTLSGSAWTSVNCAPSSLIVINGYFNFISALVDTTHLTLQINYLGTVPASGLTYAIYPLTTNEVAATTLNTRAALLLQALSLSPAGIPLTMDGTSTTDADPGTGKVRGNSLTNPTILYINKTDNIGVSIATFLAALGTIVNASSRGTLQFVPNDGSNAYENFKVTGAITDAGTYVKVPVTLLAGTVPADQAQLAMASVPSGADGTNGTNGTNGGLSSQQADNLGMAFSAGSSALTAAVKQADGATNPSTGAAAVNIGVRSATATAGVFNQRSITGALSLVVPSGATLGHVSATAASLYWYVQDNAGTLELAVSGTDQGDSFIASSTTITSGATSAATIYAATGRSNVAMRKIGKTTDTQTTAGTWAAVPSAVQLAPFGITSPEFFNTFKAAATSAAAARTSLGAVNLAGDTMTGGLTVGGLFNLGSTGQIQWPATQDPSAGANVQDDFEIGTGTASMGDGTHNYTLAAATIFYTKNSLMISAQCSSTWTSIGSATASQTTVGGFPFAIALSKAVIAFGWLNGVDTQSLQIVGDDNTGDTGFKVWRLNDNATPGAVAANAQSATGNFPWSTVYSASA